MPYVIWFKAEQIERPIVRKTRRGTQLSMAWREGFAHLNASGQRTYPSSTRREAVVDSRNWGGKAIFCQTEAEARIKLAAMKAKGVLPL